MVSYQVRSRCTPARLKNAYLVRNPMAYPVHITMRLDGTPSCEHRERLNPDGMRHHTAMSTKPTAVTDALYEYLLAHSLREHPVQRELREKTAGIKHGGMQISPDQGQFMALLARLLGARRTIEVGVFTGYSSLSVALALPAARAQRRDHLLRQHALERVGRGRSAPGRGHKGTARSERRAPPRRAHRHGFPHHRRRLHPRAEALAVPGTNFRTLRQVDRTPTPK